MNVWAKLFTSFNLKFPPPPHPHKRGWTRKLGFFSSFNCRGEFGWKKGGFGGKKGDNETAIKEGFVRLLLFTQSFFLVIWLVGSFWKRVEALSLTFRLSVGQILSPSGVFANAPAVENETFIFFKFYREGTFFLSEY